MKKIIFTLGIAALSFGVTVVSYKYERQHSVVVGNICEKSDVNPNGLCYENLPSGGFPFSYIDDSSATSGIENLGPEDNIQIDYFILDMVFYGMILFLLKLIHQRFFFRRFRNRSTKN